MSAFEIFGLKVHWYGIFYAITFVFGYIFLKIVSKSKFLPNRLLDILQNKLDDLILVIILGVLIGGRFGYVVFYDLNYYLNNVVEIFAIWHGGMSFFGGIIGCIVALAIFKKINNLNTSDILLLFDLIVIVTAFGIMIGRLGNFLNQELYGKALSNYPDFFVSILEKFNLTYVYNKVDNIKRINNNFLESFFEGFVILVVLVLIFIKKYLKGDFKPGFLTKIFIVLYSIFRFILEFFRDSQIIFAGLTISQWYMIVLFVFGLYFIKISKKLL